jgi:hypothetical protein
MPRLSPPSDPSIRLADPGTPVIMDKTGPARANRISMPLGPVLDSIDLARWAAREACARWRIGSAVDQAQTVVSELVTNAIVHAGAPIGLVVALAEPLLHIAVRDGSLRRPRLLTLDDRRGYGLLLVDAFADRWGCDRTPDGKVVWATIRLDRGGSAGS